MSYKIKAFANDAVSAMDTRSEAEIIREANIMRGEVMAEMFDRAVDFVRNVRTNIRQAFEQARTMRELLEQRDLGKPIVFRLAGTQEHEVAGVLEPLGFHNHGKLEEAVAAAVHAAGGPA